MYKKDNKPNLTTNAKTINGTCDALAPQDPESGGERTAKMYKKLHDDCRSICYTHGGTDIDE